MRFPWWLLNAALLLSILFDAWGGLYALVGIFVVLAVPGACIAARFARDAVWQWALALPLGMLWLFVPSFLVSTLQWPILSRPFLWLLALAPVALALPRILRAAPLAGSGVAALSRSRAITPILALIALSFFFVGPATLGADLPSTDASGYLERAHFVHTSLEKYGYVSLWYAGAQLGYPAYTFDPPLFYYSFGIVEHLMGVHPVVLFDAFVAVFFTLFVLGVYALAYRVVGDDVAAFAAAAMLALNPHMAGLLLYQGNIKLYSSLWLVPFILAGLVVETLPPVLLGLVLAAMALAHPTGAALALIAAIIAALLRREKSSLRHLMGVGVVLALVLAGFVLPLLVFKAQGFSYAPEQFRLPSVSEAFSWAFSEPANRRFDEHLGLVWMLLVLALGAVGIPRLVTGIGLRFGMVLGGTLLVAIVGGALTPLGELVVTFDRLLPLVLVLLACCAGMGIVRLRRISPFAPLAAAAVILCVLGGVYAPVWHDRVDQWVQTNFVTDYLAEGNGSVFSTFAKERITSYGFFAPAILPPLTIAYGIPTNSYGFSQGQHANIWFAKLVNTSTWGPFRHTTGTYLYNMFLSTGTRYIWARRCYDGGQMLLDRFVYACDNCTLRSYLVDAKDPATACEVVLELQNASLVESTTPAIAGGEDLFGETGAYRVTGMPVGADIEGLPLLSAELIAASPEPVPLAYERTDERITVRAPAQDSWVVVKEERFPRWSAAVGGSPARIHPTSLEFMLVRVPAGAALELVNEPLWWERAAAALSLLALVLLLVVPERHIYKRPEALRSHDKQ